MACSTNRKAPEVVTSEAYNATPAARTIVSDQADTASPESLWVMREGPGAKPSGMVPASRAEALRLNDRSRPVGDRFGVFGLVNLIPFGERRIKANVRRINALHADIDCAALLNKPRAFDRIMRGPLEPSIINESANGWHLYFRATDATVEWHKAICLALAVFYGGDRNALDICRVLRAPGFWHHKGEPFMVREAFRSNAVYSQPELIRAFGVKLPPPRPPRAIVALAPTAGRGLSRGDFDFAAMRATNQADLLARLSGHHSVLGETYSLRPRTGGGEIIYSNGRATSAWIDAQGAIGSLSKGGPSIWEWLVWFGHRPADIMQTLREVFPEFIAGANGGANE